MKPFVDFLRSDAAATSVEYAVILALILLVMLGAIGALGTETGGSWGGIKTKLDTAGFGKN